METGTEPNAQAHGDLIVIAGCAGKRGGGRPASARTLSTSRTGNTSGRQGRVSVPLSVIAQAPSSSPTPSSTRTRKANRTCRASCSTSPAALRQRCQLALHIGQRGPPSRWRNAFTGRHALGDARLDRRLRAGHGARGRRREPRAGTGGGRERELTELGLVAFRAVCRPDVADIGSYPETCSSTAL